jgi:hypothetical protein
MVDLGHSALTPELNKLRALYISTAQAMADSIWPESILDTLPSPKVLDTQMLALQATYKKTLNSVYVEKARLDGKRKVIDQLKKAKNALVTRFKLLDKEEQIYEWKKKKQKQGTEIPLPPNTPNTPKANKKILVNFPLEWSTKLTYDDVQSMKEFANTLDYQGVLEVFRQLDNGQTLNHLTPIQQEALKAMLEKVKTTFQCPVWKTDNSTVQLHIDFRCLLKDKNNKTKNKNSKPIQVDSIGKTEDRKNTQDKLTSSQIKRQTQDRLLATLTESAINSTYSSTPFLTSPVVAGSQPLAFNAVVHPHIVNRLLNNMPEGGEASFTSIAIELSHEEAVVKGILSQTLNLPPLSKARYILGIDWGVVNTITAVLIKIEEGDTILSEEQIKEALKWNTKQCKEYLESHYHEAQPVATYVFDGKDFIARIEEQAEHIDTLSKEIDLNYNRLYRIQGEINRILGMPDKTHVDLDMSQLEASCWSDNKRLMDLIKRFGKILTVIQNLKQKRRDIYKSVSGLKTSWFGHIFTKLAKICKEKEAICVKEYLTVRTKRRNTSEYQGKQRNKRIDYAASGKSSQAAVNKLLWSGVPVIEVPSAHTSTYYAKRGIVDKTQRKGSVFTPQDGSIPVDADENGGLNVGLWLILKLKETKSKVETLTSDKHKNDLTSSRGPLGDLRRLSNGKHPPSGG